jgi:hypothetical protein
MTKHYDNDPKYSGRLTCGEIVTNVFVIVMVIAGLSLFFYAISVVAGSLR